MSELESLDDPFGDVPNTAGEPLKIPRGGPASGGKHQNIPEPPPLPEWESTDIQDFGDGVDGNIDYSDLSLLNKDLLHLRIRMNKIRREMRRAGREAIEAKLKYQRSLRRALVQQTGGSAETRKAAAELQCEELEADMVIKAQVAEEFVTLFRAVRDDVENAKVAAYNLRALMNNI